MKVAVFLTVWALGMSPAELKDYYLDKPLEMLKSNASVDTVEFYEPHADAGELPKMDDVPSPTAIIQIDMDSEEAAQALLSSDAFREIMKAPSELSGSFEKVNLEVFQTVHYPLPGKEKFPPRTAELSFVVRYYGPVANQEEFVDFYTANHPPLLANFPNIRNVLCYLPLDYKSKGEVAKDEIVIGNEVVFDDLDGLKAALASDAMPAVSADSKHFASYGYSSHHAMLRKMVYIREH